MLRNEFKKRPIYKSPFESFRFCSREYEFMTPFCKNPITFGWKQVIQHITSVTCDSVEKITLPTLNHFRYQNDLICIAKTTGLPVRLDLQSPILLIHTEIMTLSKSRKVY